MLKILNKKIILFFVFMISGAALIYYIRVVHFSSLYYFSSFAGDSNILKAPEPVKTVKTEDFSQHEKQIVFPINWSSDRRLTKTRLGLSVSIPDGFCSIEPFEEAMKTSSIEFILNIDPKTDPKTDMNLYKWSEYVAIEKIVGQSVLASEVVNKIVNDIENDNPSAWIFSRHDADRIGCSESSFALMYRHDTLLVVIFAVYYSGPYDSSGVQYAFVVDNTTTLEIIVKKIEDFVKNNVHVVEY